MTEPRVVPLDFLSPDPRTISRAAKLLTDGELVVAPTETRYGLLGRADLPDVLERIYRIKGRAAKQPMAIFVRSVPMILHYASVPSSAERLARRFLPGPLTLVLKRLPGCDCPVVYKGKIGVRVSSAPFIRQLLECVTFPLTATSANLSGRGEVDTIMDIRPGLGDGVQLYLDSGRLADPPSTVVDCTVTPPAILRPGAIDEKEILAALSFQVP